MAIIKQQGPDRNAMLGAIQRRKRAQVNNPNAQNMSPRKFQKPDAVTPLTGSEVPTDNMPRVKPRPQGPTDNMPQTKQRQPTPMPRPMPRPGNDNALIAKKLNAMRNGGGTRMGG